MTRRRLGYLLLLFAMLAGQGFACASQQGAYLLRCSISSSPSEVEAEESTEHHEVKTEYPLASRSQNQRVRGTPPRVTFTDRLLPFALYQRPPPHLSL
ncbi:MAG: hypothetical protein ABI824_13705 [Acidobacteriota bacterium]